MNNSLLNLKLFALRECYANDPLPNEKHCDALDALFDFWHQRIGRAHDELKRSILTLNLVGIWREIKTLQKIRHEVQSCQRLIPPEYIELGPETYRKLVLRNQELRKTLSTKQELKITKADHPEHEICNLYEITGFTTACNPARLALGGAAVMNKLTLVFQQGSAAEHGFNGITDNLLFDILEDRLLSRCKSAISVREHDLALMRLKEARLWLEESTK